MKLFMCQNCWQYLLEHQIKNHVCIDWSKIKYCCKQLEKSLIIKYDENPYIKDWHNVKPGWYATIIGYDTDPGTYDEPIEYCPFCGAKLTMEDM